MGGWGSGKEEEGSCPKDWAADQDLETSYPHTTRSQYTIPRNLRFINPNLVFQNMVKVCSPR